MRLDSFSQIRLITFILAFTSVCQGQSSAVLSNHEAREIAVYTEEATVPPGLHATGFSVRVSVGADGLVKYVRNPHSLSKPLFTAAARAARHWHFRNLREGGKQHAFEAEITFYGPISGRVISRDGPPGAGVEVSGSEWRCCPTQHDMVKTDQSGSFRIEHPGSVLHFDPGESFQPQSLVVAPEMTTLKITLDPASTGLVVAACGEPRPDMERIGWGTSGLQFDVPTNDVRLIRGNPDVDYVVHFVESKSSNDHVEFWFGPYAMSPLPDDKQFLESKTFEAHNVIRNGGLVQGTERGVVGKDVSGTLPNGNVWRQVAVGLQGARYEDITAENAAVFDRIINSACWAPDAQRR